VGVRASAPRKATPKNRTIKWVELSKCTKFDPSNPFFGANCLLVPRRYKWK
jgi:hypothetical protein